MKMVQSCRKDEMLKKNDKKISGKNHAPRKRRPIKVIRDLIINCHRFSILPPSLTF